MDKETFETIDPILGGVAEVANELLESAATEKLRSLLIELNNTLGSRYLVSLHLNVTVFDAEKERCLPVLQSGFTGFDRDKPYQAVSGSSPQRYIVDGEMLVVPHDRCPRCWKVGLQAPGSDMFPLRRVLGERSQGPSRHGRLSQLRGRQGFRFSSSM